MKILFIGDISGKPGRKAVTDILPGLRDEHKPALVIANGENAAGGLGITRETALPLFDSGVDVMTLGNHTYTKRDIGPYLDFEPRILRPANFPPNNPGRGYGVFGDPPIAVINLIGRIYMDPADDPFRVADTILADLKSHKTPSPLAGEGRGEGASNSAAGTCSTPTPNLQLPTPIIVDIHAEATSEKGAMGWYLDGRVSAVIGTHTHVPTADERILPKGTGFITDAGMTGPYDSVLGLEPEIIIAKFTTMMPQKFEIASGRAIFSAVLLEVDPQTGKCLDIKRIQQIEDLPKEKGNGDTWVA